MRGQAPRVSSMQPDLDYSFIAARKAACRFISEHNRQLPSDFCPSCRDESHVPGLMCPACGYRHPVPWAILRDTEWGYAAVAISNSKLVIRDFPIEEAPGASK